jgi:transcriptional regulator with XRE-family HTH domain
MTFANHLSDLRKDRGFSVKDFAQKAKVHSTLISALQSGQRSIGENNALKIGKALGLEGIELQSFVYLALDEATDKVLKENNGYPAELLNLLAIQLRQAAIDANAIQGFTVTGCGDRHDVTLVLPNGVTATLKTQLDFAENREKSQHDPTHEFLCPFTKSPLTTA